MAGSDAVVCRGFHSDRMGGLRPARWSCVSSLVFTPDWVDGAEAERVGSQESASAPLVSLSGNGHRCSRHGTCARGSSDCVIGLGLFSCLFCGITSGVWSCRTATHSHRVRQSPTKQAHMPCRHCPCICAPRIRAARRRVQRVLIYAARIRAVRLESCDSTLC